MRRNFLGLLSLVLALGHAEPVRADSLLPLKTGDVVWSDSLQGGDPAANGWKAEGGGKMTAREDGDGIHFEVAPEAAAAGSKIARSLDAARLRGAAIAVSVRVQAEGVSAKPNPWNGIKLLLHTVTDSGADSYPQADVEVGSFGWTTIQVMTSLPRNLKSIQLVLGMEAVSGRVLFKDLRIEVVVPPWEEPPAVAEGTPVFKGHDVPALRGVMVPTKLTEEDVAFLAKNWNVNLIRWQLGQTVHKEGLETPDYDNVLAADLARLDRILPACRKYGVSVTLDLHSLSRRLFASPENQEKLIGVWRKLAAKYKDSPEIWGYDIANEPAQSGWRKGALTWNDLAEKVAGEIRKIDPEKPIIVEAELTDIPEGFETLRPLSVPRVVYSVHMYHPDQFVNSRVWNKNDVLYTYPGVIAGKKWDKAELERNLAPVIAFQKKYGVQIYVGEFSAIRWAPGAAQYLSDCIDIFEKYGWDWSYHAFHEWQGWSVEIGSDRDDTSPAKEPTDREKLLLSWFAKNQKPAWADK